MHEYTFLYYVRRNPVDNLFEDHQDSVLLPEPTDQNSLHQPRFGAPLLPHHYFHHRKKRIEKSVTFAGDRERKAIKDSLKSNCSRMRIELSPWESTDCPLSRRRKRPPKEKAAGSAEDSNHRDVFPAFSFVRTQRARTFKKPKTESLEDLSPCLVLTTESKISVVGFQNGALAVSQNRLFSCRPGKSFLSKGDDSSSSKPSMEAVPAVFDKMSDFVFVLQDDNTRLVCWPSMSSPDDGFSTPIDGFALSLEVAWGTPSLAFGTLRDGSNQTMLYIARCDQDKQEISMRSFDVPDMPKGDEDGNRIIHVTTFDLAYEANTIMQTLEQAGKRKAQHTEHDTHSDVLVFVQVFANSASLFIARHEIVVGDESDLPSYERKSVTVKEIPLPLHRQDSIDLSTVSLVGIEGKTSEFVLSYHTASGSQFIVSVSAKDAKIHAGPFDIGIQARKMSLADSRVVVAQVDRGLVFVDVLTGSVLERRFLHEHAWSKQWLFLGLDAKRSHLFGLHESESGYTVVATNLTFEGKSDPSSKTLASKLAVSLESRTEFKAPFMRRQCIEDRASGRTGYSEMAAAKNGIEMLEVTCSAVENDLPGCRDKGFVSSAFSKALEAIAHSGNIEQTEVESTVNPQDSHLKKYGEKINGINNEGSKENKTPKKLKGAGKYSLNGHANSEIKKALQISKNLHKIPSALVTQIGALAVRLLLVNRDLGEARNEARSILRKVVRSKKASARTLFSSFGRVTLRTTLKSLERRETEDDMTYSPVELLFDLLSNFPDASERHMVVGVHYMLTKATAKDVAHFFERTQRVSSVDGYRELCDRFQKSLVEDGNATEVEKCSSQLVLAGSEAFLAGILTYSNCNETLLRRAVAEYLSRGEIVVFLRVLSNVRRVAGTRSFQPDTMKRAFVWTYALCGRLRNPRSSEETEVLEKMQHSIANERRSTVVMLEMRDSLEAAISDTKETFGAIGQKKERNNRAQLPPYQLERLVI